MAAAMTASAEIQFWGTDSSLHSGKDVYVMPRRSPAQVAASVLLNWSKSAPPREEKCGAPTTVGVQLPGTSVNASDEFMRGLVRLSNAKPWGAQSTKVTAGSLSSLRKTMLAYELVNSIDIEPDTYPLPTGESTFDFLFGKKRITCIFDDTYCHILSDISGIPEDQVFEGDNLQPSVVGKYFRSLVEKLKHHS